MENGSIAELEHALIAMKLLRPDDPCVQEVETHLKAAHALLLEIKTEFEAIADGPLSAAEEADEVWAGRFQHVSILRRQLFQHVAEMSSAAERMRGA